MSVTREEQDEIERSALEAAQTKDSFLPDYENVARYLDPPEDTPFPLEYAFSLLGDVHGLTVLDYGCGAGEDAVLLAARGASVIGLDISPDLIEIARKRVAAYGFNVNFITASAYRTGLPDASVDIVFSHAILHHLDLREAKRETLRVLRGGGHLIILEPVRDSSLLAFLRRLIPYKRPFTSKHEAPLKREQLDAFCEGVRCDVVRRFRLPLVPATALLAPRYVRRVAHFDRWLLKCFPSLAYYATAEVRKLSR